MTLKQMNSELTSHILLSVLGVILAGFVIYYTMGFMGSTKSAADRVMKSTENMSSEFKEYDIAKFDGEDIRGNQVVNYIKKYLGDYSATETASIYVQVKTVISGNSYTNKYINNEHMEEIKNFSSFEFYIKPTAWFSCKVDKSTNEAILGVSFTQK